MQIVANTDAALFLLERRWPAANGSAREKAIRVCHQVGLGESYPDEAREALMGALKQAKFEVW